MAVWTTIANALVAVGAKPFATTIQALRDNIIAQGEADLSVPLDQLPTVFLGSLSTPSGSSQTLSSLDLTRYRFLRLFFNSSTTGGAGAGDMQISGGSDLITNFPAGTTFRGSIVIDLATGVWQGAFAGGGVGGGLCSIVNASTSVNLSLTSGATFTGGSVRFYGEK